MTHLDLDWLVAIDVHTHAEVSDDGHYSLPDDLMKASEKYFGATENRAPTIDQLAAYYRERSMAAVVFTVDAELALDHPPVPNEQVLEGGRRNADVLIPFASVDPNRPDAADIARRLISEHDVRGFKFHPSMQAFFPNDRMAYPLYEVIAEAGVPALFHSGQTGIGARTPGGSGIRLKYSQPLHLDDVAVDFPDLTVIIAHPSFPWQEEALSVATHKSNVYIDLSGWAPKYFPPILIQYVNTVLKRQVLFGTDFPLISPERWIAEFDALGIKDDVRPLVLKENAIRALRLGGVR